MTADAQALLRSLLDCTAVISAEPMTAPGRTGSFSDVTVADVRIDGKPARVVVRTGSPDGPFRLPEDSARQLLWYSRVAELPSHPRVLAVGMADATGAWHKLDGTPTVAVVEEFVAGRPYARDLAEIGGRQRLTDDDRQRAERLAGYLAAIHRSRARDDEAYLRGVRELVGGMEGVMSVIALYPRGFVRRHRRLLDRLQLAVAERAIELTHHDRPVAAVHGDFHPGNILFADDGELAVIDRGRIERDEAAVDVGALLVNYLALGLAAPASRAAALELARIFLGGYVSASGDAGLASVLPVHTAMRVAAVASPAFYPDLSEHVRIAILAMGLLMLDLPKLDVDDLGACLDGRDCEESL